MSAAAGLFAVAWWLFIVRAVRAKRGLLVVGLAWDRDVAIVEGDVFRGEITGMHLERLRVGDRIKVCP